MIDDGHLSVRLCRWIARVLIAGIVLGGSIGFAQVEPTHVDVTYGPLERNRLDFYQAPGEGARPLVVYIHGGGFRGGDKRSVAGGVLRSLLESGISVAAVNYRFVQTAPLPAAHHDCRRALQFLRSMADAWNIDATRVGAFGGSAGAQLCMYLAFHDDMARPASEDPIERQSTRLACVATNGGQTTMDVQWWIANIPGYDAPHRDFHAALGAQDPASFKRAVADISALSLVSEDDPPIHMRYGMAPDAPIPSGPRSEGWKVHHVQFGVALKQRMDQLGIESDLAYPGADARYSGIAEFFIDKLRKATPHDAPSRP